MKRDQAAGMIPILAVCLVAACAPRTADPGPVVLDEAPPAEALDRARGTADELGRQIVAALFRELESGNPAQAIPICAVEAQRLSAELSRDGLEVRRVSLRFRNPKGKPDPYEHRRLGELQALHDEGRMPAESAQVVAQEGVKTLRYLKPIVIKQPCLMCHGPPSQIGTDVLEALRERYPTDQAIGFELDDLRGAISVAVPLG